MVFDNQFFIKLKVNKDLAKFVLENVLFQDMVTQSVFLRPIDSRFFTNLYIGQNECLEGMYSANQIIELRDLLLRHKFMLKRHPGGYPILFSGNEVDFLGPSEFLLLGVKQSLVALSSTTLISASHVYATLGYGPIIISLIDLLTPVSDSTHVQIKERMMSQMSSAFPIHFPTSFIELSHLLNPENAKKDL